MKKLTALLLALVLLCSLAGCGKQTRAPSDDDSSSSTAQAEPPRAPGVSDPVEDEPEEPEDTDATVQPEDYLGFWEGTVYHNNALGVSYTLPDGWVYASEEELLEMGDIAIENDLLSERAKLAAELAQSNIIYGMFVQDPVNGDNIQLMFESLENQVGKDMITEETYAQIVAAQQEGFLDESSGATLSIGETYRAALAGRDCVVMPLTMTLAGIEVKEWIYLYRIEDRMALVMFTSMKGEEPEVMTGGSSAFAALDGSGSSGSSGSSGTSGALTATGDIGHTFSTMFFDYTLLSAESPAEYDGYTAQSGNKLIVVRVRVTNDFGSTLPMYDTDFPLFWGDGNNGDYAWAVDAFNDKMMPLEWELADGETAEYDMLFEVPADKMEFALSYLEEYTDRNGDDQTGDWYDAYFTLLASASA